MVKTVTLYKELNFFSFKVLKTKKRRWHFNFALSYQSINMVGQFKKAYLHRPIKASIFSHTRKNSKFFNITSKYFTFFNNKPPTSWVAHVAKHFLTCYSCSYYSSMFIVFQLRVSNSKCNFFLLFNFELVTPK